MIYQTKHFFQHDKIIDDDEFLKIHLIHEKKNFEL